MPRTIQLLSVVSSIIRILSMQLSIVGWLIDIAEITFSMYNHLFMIPPLLFDRTRYTHNYEAHSLKGYLSHNPKAF